jgi:hypothetical protein
MTSIQQGCTAGDGNEYASRIQTIVAGDPIRWHLLEVVRSMRLPDCWVGAGFVRNAVWDNLHGRAISPPSGDVDVIWFEPERADLLQDRQIESALRAVDPSVEWSVKNQARMHVRNGDAAYASTTDAMRYWPETATAVAIRRNDRDHCEIAAPFGLDDLFGLIIRPTPHFAGDRYQLYRNRMRAKGWLESWSLLRAL